MRDELQQYLQYNQSEINFKKAVILKFCLRYCINLDDINSSLDNNYSPLNEDDQNITLYKPRNEIKMCKIYITYSKIKNYLLSNPYYH